MKGAKNGTQRCADQGGDSRGFKYKILKLLKRMLNKIAFLKGHENGNVLLLGKLKAGFVGLRILRVPEFILRRANDTV